jgi:hypothetical protein
MRKAANSYFSIVDSCSWDVRDASLRYAIDSFSVTPLPSKSEMLHFSLATITRRVPQVCSSYLGLGFVVHAEHFQKREADKTTKGERRSATSQAPPLTAFYCVRVNRTSLDHLLLGKNCRCRQECRVPRVYRGFALGDESVCRYTARNSFGRIHR